MATRRVERGAVNERVARGIKELRERRRMTLADLSERLGTLGRPILVTGLQKIERAGEDGRRVDVDDLVAIALALGVTPNRLLLGAAAGDGEMALTDSVTATGDQAWRWACGESAAVLAAIDPEPADEVVRQRTFHAECHPHTAGPLTRREALRGLFAALEAATEAGLSVEELQRFTTFHFEMMGE